MTTCAKQDVYQLSVKSNICAGRSNDPSRDKERSRDRERRDKPRGRDERKERRYSRDGNGFGGRGRHR